MLSSLVLFNKVIMKKMADNLYSFKTDNVVELPESTRLYVVESRDWDRLKDTAGKCSFKKNWWDVAASVFAGAAASAVVSWLSIFRNTNMKIEAAVLIVAAIACVLLAFVCFIASSKNDSQNESKVSDILGEISFIEKKCITKSQQCES